MSGKILEAARRDAGKIVSEIGFEENIKIQTPDGNTVLEFTGLHSKHWINFDNNGNSVNSKNAHVTIQESKLRAANYPVRNPRSGEVDLLKHKITVKDETLIEKEYVINETFPSETFGLIVCVLGNYKSS